MKALGLAILLALSAAVAAPPADADSRRGDGRGHSFRSFRGRDHQLHHHHQRHPHHRGASPHRPFFPGFTSPSVVVTSPLVVAPAPVYISPAPYAPPVAYAPPPAYASPLPPVVEFSTGRYELRGDGVTSPYVWVWVPNPPAAPPAPPAPAAPPAEAPDSGGTGQAAPGRPVVIYRWTDEDGVTTWTDSLEKVPARFRAETRRSALTR
ncbi:MAG TPA: hypothetical protein VFV05_01555 [Methylomirabilota bacterium]|nr:hypothetical protein [Methylomirabilota bacterium]